MKNRESINSQVDKEWEDKKVYKIDAVFFSFSIFKKLVHSGTTDSFFKDYKGKKDKSRCIFYCCPIPNTQNEKTLKQER
jgi:hypothetical protein